MADGRDRLAAAFVELESTVAAMTRLPGMAHARATARRRRVRRVIATGVAAAAVMLAAAGVAVGWPYGAGPPDIGTPPTSTTPATTPVTATPTTPSSTSPPTPAQVLADLRWIPVVRNVTLTVPSFGADECPSGTLAFVDASWTGGLGPGVRGGTGVQVEGVAGGDIDGDAVADEVVRMVCTYGEAGEVRQIVAYSGKDHGLLGQVWIDDSYHFVDLAVVEPTGTVALELFEGEPFYDGSAIWRERFRWNGSGFDALGREDITRESSRTLRLAAPTEVQLNRDGGATVVQLVVHNDGPALSEPVTLEVDWSDSLAIEVDGVEGPIGVLEDGRYYWRVLLAAPPPAGAVEVTLRITPTGQEATSIGVEVDGHLHTDAWDRLFIYLQ